MTDTACTCRYERSDLLLLHSLPVQSPTNSASTNDEPKFLMIDDQLRHARRATCVRIMVLSLLAAIRSSHSSWGGWLSS
jgi:hypothetical protein